MDAIELRERILCYCHGKIHDLQIELNKDDRDQSDYSEITGELFGYSNVLNFLKDSIEEEREDLIASMYEDGEKDD